MGTTNCNNYNNPVAISQGGFNATTKAAAFNNISPNATKGDLLVYSGSHNVNLAVGTDGNFLTANSGATNGVNWTLPGATSVGLTSSQLSIASSPITSSGTITVNLPNSITGRNYLLNGDIQVWQRDTGGTANMTIGSSITNLKIADGWNVTTGASQATATARQTAGATTGRFFVQIQRGTANTGTGVIRLSQSLTRSQSAGAAGSIFTLSFIAKCGANYSSASSILNVIVYTGTGSTDINGSNAAFTGSATVISSTATLTTSSQSFTFTGTAAGATVTQLCVEFNFTPVGTAGASDWFAVSDAQLEIAPQATAFQRKSFAQSVKECMWFYQKSFNYAVAPATNAGTGKGEVYLVACTASGTQNGLQFALSRINRGVTNVTATATSINPLGANTDLYNLTRAVATSATIANKESGSNALRASTTTPGTGAAAGDRMIWQYTMENGL